MINANWIRATEEMGDICPLFKKDFVVRKTVARATLFASARGVYEAKLNGKRVSDYVLAPGRTFYEKRLQYQEYDITELLERENSLLVQLACGWYKGGYANWWGVVEGRVLALIAKIVIEYTDGDSDVYYTDTDWQCAKSGLLFCELYDGFIYDANIKPDFCLKTEIDENNDKSTLVPQVGEKITEHERIKPIGIIHAPNGETIIDFGQNHAGYVEITLNAKKGDKVSLSFAEILDKDGNFYTDNYRSAKCQYIYTCREGQQTFKPTLTFYGYRYVRVNEYPGEIDLNNFTSIAVYSDMKRTGYFESSDPMLNQLYSNIIWGQRSNFLDIPTDCPQRNERQGWTGDAQVFVRTASYNYNVYKFFDKWLGDMALNQYDNGAIPDIVPSPINHSWRISAAWADAVTICPWQIYITYGNKEILEKMFPSMKKWVDYITANTTRENLWLGGDHFGDWLELKAPYGECKGETRDDLIATAFYAKSTELLCKAGKVIGKDVSEYEALYKRIVNAFKAEFREDYRTQTEFILPLCFGLTDNPQKTAEGLVEMIHADGDKLQTGFVGTPYLLHVLSEHGYEELAYKLLLRKEYPSWFYPITMGATTMWEHWDGIMPDGEAWPTYMNSYNHYAYGSVADWLYGVAAGINTVEESPGFATVLFAPVADSRIDWLRAEIETAYGTIKSGWRNEGRKTIYEITTPVSALAKIAGEYYQLAPGTYTFEV